MKSFETYVHSDGTPSSYELFEQPAWRVLLGPLLYWLDLHKPRFFDPSNRGSQTILTGPRTCRCKWRLRLELWLCYEFHHKGRKVLHRVELEETV